MDTTVDTVQALRQGLRDIVALTALPTLWAGRSTPEVAEGLCQVIWTLVEPAIVYISVKMHHDANPLELVQTEQQLIVGQQARLIGEQFTPWLTAASSSPPSLVHPFSHEILQTTVLPLGNNASNGFVVVGIPSARQLTELDYLLLSVAVNQAVPVMQQTQLLAKLREVNALQDALLEKEHAARMIAEDANATKLSFLAMISHELRTPLTSIKGFTSILLANANQVQPEDRQQFLGIIDEETDKLRELVEQLLDLSRLQAGAMRIAPENIALNTIFDLARPRLGILALEHKFELVSLDVPVHVHADSHRIVQVLSNLVQNAVKYSPKHTCITVVASEQGHEVQIDVKDEGIGIPHEEHAKLFEAFHQIDRKLHPSKGAGLGLAICKGLIEAHGGKIWFQEHPTSGTVISFTLPITT